MAFTATDLATVETAMMDLAQGKRLVSVDVGGKSRQFQSVDFVKLLKFRDMIKSDINAAAGTGFVNTRPGPAHRLSVAGLGPAPCRPKAAAGLCQRL